MTSRLQRLILRLAPRSWGEAMEASTRQWVVRCPNGHEQSLWDVGGIRWGGSGKSKTRLHCPGCGKVTWMSVERTAGGNFG